MSARSPLHRYEQIAGEIRASIERAAFGPDGKLPSERRLVRTYSAQRNTVRQALSLLEREGKIQSVGKSGWYVTEAGLPARPASLVGQRVVLVTFRRASGSTIDRLTEGLREELLSHGVQMLRYDSSAPEESKHIETVEQLTTVDADGIVMWPRNSVERRLLARLQDTVPLVLVDRRIFGFESDNVRFDDDLAGRTITEHLIGRGHRRIAFLGDEPFVESVQSRWRGYRQAMEAAGIAPEERLTTLTYGRHEPAFTGHVDVLLREKPTAIVCSNDGVASQLLLVLRKEGVRTPEDIAISGFGNDGSDYLDVIGLTTMAQPFGEVGRAAGRLLVERMSGTVAGRCREVLVPMSLVARHSTERTMEH